jgi:hypothetical protein
MGEVLYHKVIVEKLVWCFNERFKNEMGSANSALRLLAGNLGKLFLRCGQRMMLSAQKNWSESN